MCQGSQENAKHELAKVLWDTLYKLIFGGNFNDRRRKTCFNPIEAGGGQSSPINFAAQYRSFTGIKLGQI